MKKIVISALFAAMSAVTHAASPIVFDLENTLRNPPGTGTINDLIEEISYIPLETHKDALLREGNKMAVIDSDIYIGGVSMSPIYRFGSNGKFVRQMTYVGRGPGEYVIALLWYANASTGRINVIDPVGGSNMILVSTGNGQRSSVRWSFKDGFGWIPLNDGTFVSYKALPATRREPPKLSLHFMDKEGKTVGSIERRSRYEPDPPSFALSSIFEPSENYFIESNYKGEALLHEIYSDTISTIKSRGEAIVPHLVFKRGRFAPAPNSRDSKRRSVDIGSIIENAHHVNLSFRYDGKSYSDIWSKSSGDLLLRRVQSADDDEKGGFPLRLPDGNVIHIEIAYADSDRFYCVMEALDACKFLPGIKEDDNPVVVVMKLKQ